MGGRAGLGRAVAGGAAIAFFCLLLLPGSGAPLVAGRPPTTPEPDPFGLPPGEPTTDLDTFSVRVSAADVAALDRAVRQSLTYFEAPASLVDLSAEPGVDGGEHRSVNDGPTGDTTDALAAVLLVMFVLTAVRDQDRERLRRATAPASATVAANLDSGTVPAPGDAPERATSGAAQGPGDRTPVRIGP